MRWILKLPGAEGGKRGALMLAAGEAGKGREHASPTLADPAPSAAA